MNVPEFQAKWQGSTLKERSAAQEHFLDLCRLLGMPTPAEADKTGAFYTFEKGATKTAGGQGFADVWWEGRFAWEYKGHRADLKAAYQQLLQYREDLGNPPLLVVCDLDRFEVHTNFTGTKKDVHAFGVADLDKPEVLAILRAVFSDPEALRPGQTAEDVTVEAAARFGQLAAGLQARGVDPHRAAHFLVQLLFCLFAEDVGLLPKGLFTNLLALGARHPDAFDRQIGMLLAAMRDGGAFGVEWVVRFNGGLFATIDPAPLTADELAGLRDAAALDWGAVEPAIFGTLFERSLDPGKRSQLGAHYTGRHDIERVVEPVVMAPLRRRWEAVRAEADRLKATWDTASADAAQRSFRDRARATAPERARAAFAASLSGFQHELATVRVLDPACGSGNFLYVALAKLLDLEKEVLVYGAANGLPLGYPLVSPAQVAGLEVNEYARELAQVVVWIGYLQWRLGNGFSGLPDPILEPLETIRLQDALLDRSVPGTPREAEWPAADFIIGNPPFLGGNKVRAELGDAYLADLFAVYDGRVARFADLVCYFFEKARLMIAEGSTERAGLLATNSIRGGANRRVLERIKQTGDIFAAWDDEPWILDGAAVRISIVGFDDGSETARILDGRRVAAIHADLTAEVDVTKADQLAENAAIAFTGIKKTGPFEIPGSLAEAWLRLPVNVNGRPNSDVLRPLANGYDVTRRPRGEWIVDFGVDRDEREAAAYQAPYEYVREHVLPVRAQNRDPKLARLWWLHERARPEMRTAFSLLDRFLATPVIAKHRVFVWLPAAVLPDHQLVVFARQDDYFFGVMHSRAHAVWSLRMGTSLEDRPRYTPTTCFETFPLPWPPGQEPWRDPRIHAIANAANALDAARRAYLDPPDATADVLKKRTLTNLYNERPTWLALLHADLDRAVWAAYGWDNADPAAVADDDILARLLDLNGARAATGPGPSRSPG